MWEGGEGRKKEKWVEVPVVSPGTPLPTPPLPTLTVMRSAVCVGGWVWVCVCVCVCVCGGNEHAVDCRTLQTQCCENINREPLHIFHGYVNTTYLL